MLVESHHFLLRILICFVEEDTTHCSLFFVFFFRFYVTLKVDLFRQKILASWIKKMNEIKQPVIYNNWIEIVVFDVELFHFIALACESSLVNSAKSRCFICIQVFAQFLSIDRKIQMRIKRNKTIFHLNFTFEMLLKFHPVFLVFLCHRQPELLTSILPVFEKNNQYNDYFRYKIPFNF